MDETYGKSNKVWLTKQDLDEVSIIETIKHMDEEDGGLAKHSIICTYWNK